MKKETIYSEHELETGECTLCGEQSDEILISDGRCIDCIESEAFYEETMKGL